MIFGYLILMQRNTLSGSRKRKRNRNSPGSSSSSVEENETEPHSLSDAGLSFLGVGCKQLEHLSLTWCQSLTSLGLVSIAENCRALKSLEIQVLSLFNLFLYKIKKLLKSHITKYQWNYGSSGQQTFSCNFRNRQVI